MSNCAVTLLHLLGGLHVMRTAAFVPIFHDGLKLGRVASAPEVQTAHHTLYCCVCDVCINTLVVYVKRLLDALSVLDLHDGRNKTTESTRTLNLQLHILLNLVVIGLFNGMVIGVEAAFIQSSSHGFVSSALFLVIGTLYRWQSCVIPIMGV